MIFTCGEICSVGGVSVVVDSLLLQLFVGVLCLSLFYRAVHSVISSFAIISLGKRELVA